MELVIVTPLISSCNARCLWAILIYYKFAMLPQYVYKTWTTSEVSMDAKLRPSTKMVRTRTEGGNKVEMHIFWAVYTKRN